MFKRHEQTGGYQQGARPHQGLKNDTDGGFDGILGSAPGSSKMDICRRAYEMAGMMGGDAD